MKTNHLTPYLAAAAGLALLSTTGCFPKEEKVEATLPSAQSVAANSTPATTPAKTPLPPVTLAAPRVTSTSWTEIKDATFDQRALFFANLAKLETTADAQVSELTVQRASMSSNARTQEWDAAMKEMNDARTYFRGMVEEIKTAQNDTWQERKDRIGLAWTRLQDAHAKVKASVTQ